MAVGDIHEYGNGTLWVETEGGPNVTMSCVECGAPAIAHIFVKVVNIRCGQCWQRRHGLLPGQWGYEDKRKYAEQHRPRRVERGTQRHSAT